MKTPFGAEFMGDTTQVATTMTARGRRWAPLLVVSAVLAVLVGTSLAASITVNDGDPIEFGQGKQAATACDESIDTAIVTASYSEGTFETSTFRIDELDLTHVDLEACAGKTFTVSFLNSAGEALGVCEAGTSCTAVGGGPFYNAGFAVVKFTVGTCDSYAYCPITYFGNPGYFNNTRSTGGVAVSGSNNGIAYVWTDKTVGGTLADDGTVSLSFMWGYQDPFTHFNDRHFMVRAEFLAGVTIETT